MTLTVGGLFSGIGGFELGLVRAGFEIIWMVEIDEFCQKVLKKHAPIYWPNAKIYGDIKNVGKENLTSPDVIVGGFPCQPFSQAGKRNGKEDDRYLWPEMLRVIRELSPHWIIGENVAGFINMELESAFTDLETKGYQVEAFVLPACAVDAPHQRNRIWIVAYPPSQNGRCVQCLNPSQKSLYPAKRSKSPLEINGSGKVMAYTNSERWNGRAGSFGPEWGIESKNGSKLGDAFGPRLAQRESQRGDPQPQQQTVIGASGEGREWWAVEPKLGRVANGIPNRVDRLRGLGNAVVPQIPELLGRMILEVEGLTQ